MTRSRLADREPDYRVTGDDIVLDADALAFLDQYAAEVRKTLAGHWHPDTVECSERCPMGDPRTRYRFRLELDRAAAGKAYPASPVVSTPQMLG